MSTWRWATEARCERPRVFVRHALRYYALRATFAVAHRALQLALFCRLLMTADDVAALARVALASLRWFGPRLERAHGDMIAALRMWDARKRIGA